MIFDTKFPVSLSKSKNFELVQADTAFQAADFFLLKRINWLTLSGFTCNMRAASQKKTLTIVYLPLKCLGVKAAKLKWLD